MPMWRIMGDHMDPWRSAGILTTEGGDRLAITAPTGPLDPLTGGDPMSSSPVQRLRGDLRAQSRYAALTAALGEPQNDAEAAVLVLLARLLGNDETATLLLLVQRAGTAERG